MPQVTNKTGSIQFFQFTSLEEVQWRPFAITPSEKIWRQTVKNVGFSWHRQTLPFRPLAEGGEGWIPGCLRRGRCLRPGSDPLLVQRAHNFSAISNSKILISSKLMATLLFLFHTDRGNCSGKLMRLHKRITNLSKIII
eukprot:g17160.t1